MMPKFANIGFNPMKNAITPKPTSNMIPALPPITGTGNIKTGPGIPSMPMSPGMATAPKIAAMKAPENAAPMLMPIPHSGPVTAIAKAPTMGEMTKIPSLKKIAGFDTTKIMNLLRSAKGGIAPIEKAVTSPSFSIGKQELASLSNEGASKILAQHPKIPPVPRPVAPRPNFSVGKDQLQNMGNDEASKLLRPAGAPTIPPMKTPVPGTPAHGTVVQRHLGK